MKKIDLRNELKYLYAPSVKEVEVVDVPNFQFVMIDGTIDPGETPQTSEAFQNAIKALYGVSFTLKFVSKLREDNPIDYSVMVLEGLWWGCPGEFDFVEIDQSQWTMMIMQPDHITEHMCEVAIRELKEKKENPALSHVRFESFHEGLCIQTMHIGPYADEPKTIDKMNTFAEENGFELCGKHHEIYLGDPRRCKPERLRTILRHPVREQA